MDNQAPAKNALTQFEELFNQKLEILWTKCENIILPLKQENLKLKQENLKLQKENLTMELKRKGKDEQDEEAPKQEATAKTRSQSASGRGKGGQGICMMSKKWRHNVKKNSYRKSPTWRVKIKKTKTTRTHKKQKMMEILIKKIRKEIENELLAKREKK